MTVLSPDKVFRVLDATWPPVRQFSRNGWRFREGGGGGQRVTAATVEDSARVPSLAAMERQQVEFGQQWLAMIRPSDAALDAAMEAQGYEIGDPTQALAVRLEDLVAEKDSFASYPTWPPLALQEELWATDGVGPSRLAVMERVAGPKAALLGRAGDAPVATAFVAENDGVAMVHALVVAEEARRRGYGRAMMQGAADWARQAGAEWLAVLVVKANAPAMTLYRSIGLKPVTEYHYRRLPA